MSGEFNRQAMLLCISGMNEEQLKVIAAVHLEMLERYHQYIYYLCVSNSVRREELEELITDMRTLSIKFNLAPASNEEIDNDTVKH
jgi:hypothetical protein